MVGIEVAYEGSLLREAPDKVVVEGILVGMREELYIEWMADS